MALGLLLQVSWICILLFDGSAGLPTIKGYGYPHKSDSQNIGDDGEDETWSSPTFDQSYWQASNTQQAEPVYTIYSQPSVSQESYLTPSQQNPPKSPGAFEVNRINAAPRDWGQENPDELLLFPLNYQPAKPQPNPVQPQSTSVGLASPGAGSSSQYAAPPAPPSTSEAAESQSFGSWQHEPGYSAADLNAGYSAAESESSSSPQLDYEQVFQYTSTDSKPSQSNDALSGTGGEYSQVKYESEASKQEEASVPSYPSNEVAEPAYAPEPESQSFSFAEEVKPDFGQTVYQPHDEEIPLPQEPVVSIQKVVVPQRVSEPILPPPLPSSYIVQSRNGYQRAKYVYSNSKYSPDLPFPKRVSLKRARGPAPRLPAAPKGVKQPQGIKW